MSERWHKAAHIVLTVNTVIFGPPTALMLAFFPILVLWDIAELGPGASTHDYIGLLVVGASILASATGLAVAWVLHLRRKDAIAIGCSLMPLLVTAGFVSYRYILSGGRECT